MSQKQDIQILQTILKQLPQEQEVIHTKQVTAASNQQELKLVRRLKGNANLSTEQVELYQNLKDQSDTLGDEFNQEAKDEIKTLIQTLTPKYQIGASFKSVEGIERITFLEDKETKVEDATFQTDNGTVYLVDIWATWCGPCQGPMKHNQDMLEKNKEWEGKVKIVGISVDDDSSEVIERVQSKQWKSIEHFRIKKGWDDQNDLIKFFQLRGIPFVTLINKWGKIVYLGHPSKGNLEQRINEEIQAENDTTKVQVNEVQQNNENYDLLTKDEYKQLKETIKKLQQALIDAQFEGIVSANITKTNLWKQSGQKEVQQRSKIVLSYDIDQKEEEKLNNFLNAFWNTIPENLRSVKEAKIRDPVRQTKEIKQKFQETFSDLGVVITYQPKTTVSIKYNQKEKKFKNEESQEFQVNAQNLSATTFKQGMEKLEQFLSQFEEEEESSLGEVINKIVQGLKASYQLGAGKQFETIVDYKKWGSEEYTQIEHVPGQVLVIDYWAQWCGPCVREIEKNTKLLLDKPPHWENSVRFVTLSLVLGEDAAGFMNAHKESQSVIDFYFPKAQRQQDTSKYGVQYIPHYVIVDKFGIINQIAHVDNVKELVDKLLQQTAPQQGEQQYIGITSQTTSNISQLFLNEEINKQFAQIDPQGVITFNLTIESIQNGEQVIYQQPKLNCWIRDSQQQQFNELLSKVYEIIPETQFNSVVKIQNTFNVEYPGKECVLCKKDISQDKQQYYSPFKKEHVCVECAEFDDQSKTGSARYKYLDTLIFINGPLSDNSLLLNFDSHKLGKNLKLKDDEEGSQSHPMMCNGCRTGGGKGPRYISLNARPGPYSSGGYIDYCQNCFLILKDKDSDKAKEIVANDASEGMISDSLFLRVLFNYGGYQDF